MRRCISEGDAVLVGRTDKAQKESSWVLFCWRFLVLVLVGVSSFPFPLFPTSWLPGPCTCFVSLKLRVRHCLGLGPTFQAQMPNFPA